MCQIRMCGILAREERGRAVAAKLIVVTAHRYIKFERCEGTPRCVVVSSVARHMNASSSRNSSMVGNPAARAGASGHAPPRRLPGEARMIRRSGDGADHIHSI